MTANPWDRPAARALYQVLGEVGDGVEQRRVAVEQALLARATENPPEVWFAGVEPAGPSPVGHCNYQLIWKGDIRAVHSFAHVNRQIGMQLLAQGGRELQATHRWARRRAFCQYRSRFTRLQSPA